MNQPPGSHDPYSHPYAQYQPPSPPGGAYGSAVYAPPAEPHDQDDGAPAYGDKAFEHLYMKRGRFTAWPYVVIAFLMEAALVGCVTGLPVGLALGAITNDGGVASSAGALVGLPAGITGAYFVFRDRWRVVEAFSSRFCVGIMNISLFFVPIVALVYANVRGIQKLSGK